MGFLLKQLYSARQLFSKKPLTKGLQFITWNAFLKDPCSLSPTIFSSDTNAPALFTYTGGTTGVPKGVVLSNTNINSVAEQYKNATDSLECGQSWLTVSAPFIAYALIVGLHLPLSYGMECCIELYEPETIAKNIIRKKINHITVTPVVFKRIISLSLAQNADLSFLIAPICGADALNIQLEQRINQFLLEHGCMWKICQGYGMTELGTAVSVNISLNCNRLGSVGVPFGNTMISTFDTETDVVQKIGEVGEICVQGPSMMLGYYNDPTATNFVIRQHSDGSVWFHTGDLGHLDEDGFLYIDGKIKRMITRFDGFKVFPSVVEEVLLKYATVEQCVIVETDDIQHGVGQLSVAFVVLSEDCNVTQAEVIKQLQVHCNSLLPQYGILFHIISAYLFRILLQVK